MHILVVGASSFIAKATAELFARQGWSVILAGRDPESIRRQYHDSIALPADPSASVLAFDALDPQAHEKLWSRLPQPPDVILCAVGELGDSEQLRVDPAAADRILRVNFTGLVPLFSLAANVFESRGHGTIIGISSVAGERGRAGNYVYGSAKAGLTAFLSGLRNRLARKKVGVVTILPGYVRTPMLPRGPGILGNLVTASPEQAARAIFAAYRNNRDVVYIRWFWRWILFALRCIPEKIFKRLAI